MVLGAGEAFVELVAPDGLARHRSRSGSPSAAEVDAARFGDALPRRFPRGQPLRPAF